MVRYILQISRFYLHLISIHALGISVWRRMLITIHTELEQPLHMAITHVVIWLYSALFFNLKDHNMWSWLYFHQILSTRVWADIIISIFTKACYQWSRNLGVYESLPPLSSYHTHLGVVTCKTRRVAWHWQHLEDINFPKRYLLIRK